MATDNPGNPFGKNTEAAALEIQAARAQIEAARLRREALIATGQLPDSATTPSASLPTKDFPGYTLLRELHRGGQGVVYLAKQESTDRQVAVKVLRHGPLAHPDELARFKREVEVLCLLKHPHVVSIYDCGRADEKLFLVMDYVAGHPLDGFVANVKPSISDTLQLFAKICDGVNAAHLRGIIHRDLKPSNIRVDEQGEPRVLDFGLAKLIGQNNEATTAGVTLTGQFVGSLPWSSPEQTAGKAELLDVRSDVYSLGVILYQLLTGSFPYPVSGRMDDVVRHIAETDPMRPSTQARGIDPDVETIVLKCLAKEPERRYQSAGELARDIRHYLAREPIEAKRDSMRYVLGRYLARHRFAAAGAMVVLLAVTTSAVISFTSWRNAERARLEEQRHAKRSEAMYQFFTQAMISSDPFRGGKQGMLVRDAMEQAVKTIDGGAFTDDPRIESDLLQTISRILLANGRSEAALELIERANKIDEATLPPDDSELASTLNDFGLALSTLGKFDEALPKFETALAMSRQTQAGDHALTASILHNMGWCLRETGRAADAVTSYQSALEMRRRLYPGDHSDVAASLAITGTALKVAGRVKEAYEMDQAALAMYERLHSGDHPNIAMALNEMGMILDIMGKSPEALPLHERAVAMRRRIFEGDQPELAQGLNNLGVCFAYQQRFAEALPHFIECAEMYQRLFPGDHPQVCNAVRNVGACLAALGRLDEAAQRFATSLDMDRRLHKTDHESIASALSNLGSLENDLGKVSEALAKHEESLAMRRRLFPGDHPSVAKGFHNVGACLRDLHRADEAAIQLEAALTMRRRLFPQDHPETAISLEALAEALSLTQRAVEAEGFANEAVAMYERLFNDDDVRLAAARVTQAVVLHRMSRGNEALAALESGMAALSRIESPNPKIKRRMLEFQKEIVAD